MKIRRRIRKIYAKWVRVRSARTQTTDTYRWGGERIEDQWGQERYEKILPWIPETASVLELGAGNGHLKNMLPAGCAYQPTDLVARTEAFMALDLNADTLPDLEPRDVCVAMGVIEYVIDPPRCLRWISGHAPTLLLSYAVAAGNVAHRADRRKHGWMNDFDEAQITAMVTEAGWRVRATDTWCGQLLMQLERAAPA